MQQILARNWKVEVLARGRLHLRKKQDILTWIYPQDASQDARYSMLLIVVVAPVVMGMDFSCDLEAAWRQGP